ncbi:MAG: OmpW family outer membrane protein [Pseudomonadota bacterium]|nr:OmpW family outer membrane protein [Pseudomonadota bacterium]
MMRVFFRRVGLLGAICLQLWIPQAVAAPPGPWYVVLGPVVLDIQEESDELVFEAPVTAPVVGTVLPGGDLPGSGVSLSDEKVLALTIGYQFTPWFSLETFIGGPVPTFEIESTGTLRNAPLAEISLPLFRDIKVGPIPGKIGEAKAIPFVVQTLLRPVTFERWRPFVSIGLMYLVTFDEQATVDSLGIAADDPTYGTQLEVSDEWGLLAGVGVDYQLTPHWFVHGHVSYGHMEVEARLTNLYARIRPIGIMPASDASVDVPTGLVAWNLGIGYRF